MPRFLLTTAALTLGLASGAHALEYRAVVPAQSSVTFEYQQMGVTMDGRFKRFMAELVFDPARPQAAKAAFDIDLSSIDAGSPEADDAAAEPDWFNFQRFPRARFVSKSVRALGNHRYELRGVLTLKGKSREMAVPVSYRPAGKTAVLDGAFSLRRLDFGVGAGPWADTDTVANEVKVRVRLTVSGQ